MIKNWRDVVENKNIHLKIKDENAQVNFNLGLAKKRHKNVKLLCKNKLQSKNFDGYWEKL